MGINRVSDSRLKVYQMCQRQHYYIYHLGYRPIEKGEAADFGTVGHSALQAWWGAHQRGLSGSALWLALQVVDACDLDEFTKIKLKVVIHGYDLRWAGAMADYEVLFVEQWFDIQADGYSIVGKIDAGVRQRSTGRVMIVEHKFTSADLQPSSDYWRKLRMEPQVSGYYRGMRQLGHAPVACLWDVVSRPEIKPLKATPEEDRKYTKATAKEPSRLYANQRLEDETPEEFQERLMGLVGEDWFVRREVVRLQEELEDFDRDLHALAIQALTPVTHAPRNPDSCRKFGRLCEFEPVCTGTGTLDDETKYERKVNK